MVFTQAAPLIADVNDAFPPARRLHVYLSVASERLSLIFVVDNCTQSSGQGQDYALASPAWRQYTQYNQFVMGNRKVFQCTLNQYIIGSNKRCLSL